eukprot:scaffold230349_cov52-Attheya_sp.AAC.1
MSDVGPVAGSGDKAINHLSPRTPVQTHVDNHSGNSLRGFFLDLDDVTGGIADIADPDEHIDFCASGVGL